MKNLQKGIALVLVLVLCLASGIVVANAEARAIGCGKPLTMQCNNCKKIVTFTCIGDRDVNKTYEGTTLINDETYDTYKITTSHTMRCPECHYTFAVYTYRNISEKHVEAGI